ncbi:MULTISPECIES: epoxide hydrolase family protein [unclassified Sphingobium]|uniref:epoxide hydrolase family protein n=1 Tax=unclassified Sphingobium TaxID=2611147 RepID=UPI000D167796|nr:MULTISPECIES: epoxide hydrolase family protein [unclassified Sphingobium]MBG6120055.1 pimeloyl-ACP methyl ester carboxylesterase [Sphingobium sp. JAI105]PSO12891.1 hypothetical protein C7E20_03840 [Sphingobium sp. AEW4]TWD05744.1 pimeloyl-ACP methyl ester carboxylesterase [Sphingobium sp. AEW010]TWD23297.1 pimeloyl-ACP methyl ester carboxylesterase [Sphingobium sp. AEW013]TWD25157.1 pimeloyl-ACP methyl ester carboxylesterase [Sphingobium sp. AEW001]
MIRIEPYRVDVPLSTLDDLHDRLSRARIADDFGNADWRYGVERSWLAEMVAYWRDEYDWGAQQAAINALPNFHTEIDGVPIHFLHVKGKGPSPTPLILTHGWPWTFWDYRDLIGPLTDPAAHGGDPAMSFDLVIPSLPGFGFSTPLTKTGVDAAAIAQLWVKLMGALGYPRFGAAGGDWGAIVTTQLGHAHEEHLIGVYATLVTFPGMDRAHIDPGNFAPYEQWMLARLGEAAPLILSHWTTHRLDPQTLAYALVDSPVGTAAWIWERRRAWSDCGGDLLRVMDRDALCTLASIYWLNGSIASSMRLYWEQFKDGLVSPLSHDRKPVIPVPTGYAIFPKDVAMVPRAVAAENTDLRRWTVMPRGGHFGPAEAPDLVVNELRAFFGAEYCRDRLAAN